jgi:cholesterol transport system auxiliary component
MSRVLRYVRLPLVALVVAVAGCGQPLLTQSEAPSSLLLDAAPSVRPAPRNTGLTLLVSPPQAQAGFDTRRIAYTRTPLTIEYYTRSEWADTPARMLGPLAVRALESSGAFRAVIAGPAPVPVDLRLDLELIRLQQEFNAAGSQVRLELRAKLFDVRAGRVLATQVFTETAPAPSLDALGGARAASVATGAALEALAAFVVEALPRH